MTSYSQAPHSLETLRDHYLLFSTPENIENVVPEISAAIATAIEAGAAILPKSPDQIRTQINKGLGAVIFARTRDEVFSFRYYVGLTPLVDGDDDVPPIYERGTLIANPAKDGLYDPNRYTASDAIQLVNSFVTPESLILSTVRSRASLRAALGAGMMIADRLKTPALDALTCAEECAPGNDGGTSVPVDLNPVDHPEIGQCYACPVSEAHCSAGLSDPCRLTVNDLERAQDVNAILIGIYGSPVEVRKRFVG